MRKSEFEKWAKVPHRGQNLILLNLKLGHNKIGDNWTFGQFGHFKISCLL